MGKDKYENEDLIKYGWPEDVWFHVDDLSSAHVYLRMKPGMTLDDISEELLLECASLVKANSIQGCKVCCLFLETRVCCVPLLQTSTTMIACAIICRYMPCSSKICYSLLLYDQ